MRLRTEHIAIGGLAIVVAWYAMFKTRLINKLAAFIPSVEGFRSHPYWDEKRYSWGYGTAAPGSTGTISRDQAFADMVSYLLNDYDKLKGRVSRSLTVSQWAAFLSFSYNLGIGHAYDMVPYINANNDTALATQWRKYVYAGGVRNAELVERRDKELKLWIS